jgi:hypothetical protein
MNHVVMFSGGIGSWAAAKRVAEEHGTSSLYLLFTDTLIEDEDLYRFLVEAAANIYGIDGPEVDEVSSMWKEIPTLESLGPMGDTGPRKEAIYAMRDRAKEVVPGLVWIAEGRTPWEVFFDVRFLGNSRIDPCSRILKREAADDWIEGTFDPDDVVCYVGIDWSEVHRFERLEPRKLPYVYKAPLTESPWSSHAERLEMLSKEGIRTPRLYGMGFGHNNCGGFCIKAGQGHYATLLSSMPDRFDYHEQMEREIAQFLDADVAMMKKSKDGETRPFTMKDLRIQVEEGQENLDLFDHGGCGCFLDSGDQ